jgi:hypothetical protein
MINEVTPISVINEAAVRRDGANEGVKTMSSG